MSNQTRKRTDGPLSGIAGVTGFISFLLFIDVALSSPDDRYVKSLSSVQEMVACGIALAVCLIAAIVERVTE